MGIMEVNAGVHVVGSLVYAEGGSARKVGGEVEVARQALVGPRPALLHGCRRSISVKVLREVSERSGTRKNPVEGVPSGRV